MDLRVNICDGKRNTYVLTVVMFSVSFSFFTFLFACSPVFCALTVVPKLFGVERILCTSVLCHLFIKYGKISLKR